MKTRPLCFACLFFLLFQSILFILTSGESLAELPASSVFREGEGKSVLVKGQVSKKSNTSNSQILYLINNSIEYQEHLYYDSKLIVYLEKNIEIPIGKTVSLKGSTVLFESARNPGNFDSTLYYAKQDIYGAIYCDEILEICGQTNQFMEYLHQCKMNWKANLSRAMGDETSAVLAAMLLGEKSEMDAEVKELYQKNGIGHILAISGLHISFIGLGIYHLIRKTGLGYLPTGILALGVLTLYVLMIGFSVSVLRAYVMLLLRIGADISGRVYDMITALLLGAALTIALQPLYLTDAGFYMSYGAILGILLLLPVLQRCFRCRRKWLSGVYTSFAVNLMLFPILLWFYYEFPTYSVLWNLIVIPLMTLVMGFGMFGSILIVLAEPIGKFCLEICDWILRLFELISRVGSELPMARIVTGQPDLWKMIVYYVMLFGMLLWMHRCKQLEGLKKRRKYLCLALVVAVFLVAYRTNSELTITMLDVGQGDGIFIEGPKGVTYLIDGGSSDVEQLGRYRIEPFLKSQGVGVVDYVFITHGDTDHYSGIVEMLERQTVGVRIQNLVFPANFQQDEVLPELASVAQSLGVNVLCMNAGERLTEGEFLLSCIQPGTGDDKLTGNAGSLVLEVCYGEFSMLCTGDVEAEGEEKLLQKLKGRAYDVLKVAHHGSKNFNQEIICGQRDYEKSPILQGLQRLWEVVRCAGFQTVCNT